MRCDGKDASASASQISPGKLTHSQGPGSFGHASMLAPRFRAGILFEALQACLTNFPQQSGGLGVGSSPPLRLIKSESYNDNQTTEN